MPSSPTRKRTRHAGIYKRGGSYEVRFRHRGKQHARYFRSLAEAREFQGRTAAGERRVETRRTFEDYAAQWIDSYLGRTARGLGPKTRGDYRASLNNRLVPHFGRRRLADIDPPDVRRYVAELQSQGLAPSTIRKEVAALRALLATALEDGAIRSNPAAGIRVSGRQDAGEADELPRALTVEQLRRLLAELPAEHRLLHLFLVETGLRISEAIGVCCGDLELGERPHLRVRRQRCRGRVSQLKTSSGRRDVPLSSGMVGHLATLASGRPVDASLFVTTRGTTIDDGNLRARVLRPTAERAGVPWVRFHELRHTCASMLFGAGKNIKQVQGWLGHADPGFTLSRYVHLIGDGLGDAEIFDRAEVWPALARR